MEHSTLQMARITFRALLCVCLTICLGMGKSWGQNGSKAVAVFVSHQNPNLPMLKVGFFNLKEAKQKLCDAKAAKASKAAKAASHDSVYVGPSAPATTYAQLCKNSMLHPPAISPAEGKKALAKISITTPASSGQGNSYLLRNPIEGINLSPNPADARTGLRITSSQDKALDFKLYNPVGQLSRQGSLDKEVKLDLYNLPAGAYTLRFSNGGQMRVMLR